MSYQLIETINVATDSAGVSIENIPQDGTDLLLSVATRNYQTTSYNLEVVVNDNTTSKVDTNLVLGNGSTIYNSSFTDRTYALVQGGNVPNNTTNIFSNTDFYFPDYAGSQDKFMNFVAGTSRNNTSEISFGFADFEESNGITKITLGEYIAAGSTLSLYKITSA